MVITLERSRKLESQRVHQEGEPPETVQEPIEESTEFKNEILLLISAPLLTEELAPVEALSIQKEIEGIVDILESLPHITSLEITVKIATTESLLEIFSQRIKPLIIHFIGHGMPTDRGIALLLEDAVGIARPFTENELNTLLVNRTTPPCQLALLNACHSQGLADELVEAGVPHIIAVNAEDTVLDIAARTFSQHLYQALLNNFSIIEAFEHSRSAVRVNDELRKLFNPTTFQRGVNLEEALKFHLFPQNSSEHHAPLNFQSLSRGQIIAPSWENTNIPSDDLTFIGRRIDLYHIATDLHATEHRCIALHGMGGMGKTALAYAVGRWQHERRRWQDGVWFIELRDVNSQATAVSQIAETLSLKGAIAPNRNLIPALKDKKILLILDDVDRLIEHDWEGLTQLVTALLTCRRLKLLITSREDLPSRLYYQRREVRGMERSDAIQAFRTYLLQVENWNLEASQTDFEALIEFFEGYPFPIRLAAKYMQETRCSLQKLCQRLQIDPCNTLKSRRGPENRENSLKATLELSYSALPPGAKEMFPRLALFPGGLSEELAAFVWGQNSFEDLTTLLQFSMAEMPKTHTAWRVTLPEPARRYAESKQLQGMEAFAPKVLEYFYGFAQRMHDLLAWEAESKEGKQRLLQERSNLNHFLQWGYEQENSRDRVCRSARITALLGKFWQLVAPSQDPIVALRSALEAAQRNGDILGQADVQKTRGDIQLLNQGLKIAKASYQQAIEFYKSASKNAERDLEIANILEKIGEIHKACQEFNLALESFSDALNIYLEEGEPLEAARIKLTIGQIYELAKNAEKALESYEEAKQLYISQSDLLGVAKADTLIRKLQKNVEYTTGFSFETVTVNRKGEIIKRETRRVQYFSETLENNIVLNLVAIPGGTFMMGSPEGEGYPSEKPQHEVTVQPFFMGQTPITQAQWRAIASRTDLKVECELNPDPSRFKDTPDPETLPSSSRESAPTRWDRPVERVSWYDAMEFCARLSRLTGRDYRLPSEAEWEYACRAVISESSGNLTYQPFHFGETLTDRLANYRANSTYAEGPEGECRRGTTPVGSFSPNAFGLYDLHGNVWEWCADTWHDDYEGAPDDGSAWLKDGDENLSPLRGGSLYYYPYDCRGAFRSRNFRVERDFINGNMGFRVVCEVGGTPET